MLYTASLVSIQKIRLNAKLLIKVNLLRLPDLAKNCTK